MHAPPCDFGFLSLFGQRNNEDNSEDNNEGKNTQAESSDVPWVEFERDKAITVEGDKLQDVLSTPSHDLTVELRTLAET